LKKICYATTTAVKLSRRRIVVSFTLYPVALMTENIYSRMPSWFPLAHMKGNMYSRRPSWFPLALMTGNFYSRRPSWFPIAHST
jgi:hypothetical protein